MLSRNSVSQDGYAWFKGDLSDPNVDLGAFLKNVDVLYHCAGEVKDQSKMEALHIKGTERLVVAASGNIGRWVQLSSVGAFGARKKGIVTEETPEMPIGVYETTKTISDEIVKKATTAGAFESVILRPSNVYGNDMTNQSLFQLASMINRGLYFYIGNKSAMANYIHVKDVARALIKCGEMPAANGKTYVLSDHCPLHEMVEAMASGLGVQSPKMRLPEFPLRLLTYVLAWLPHFPLSTSRINVLTNKIVYCENLIKNDLMYTHHMGLQEGFQKFGEAINNR